MRAETAPAQAAAPSLAAHTQGALLLECRGVVQGVGFRPAVHRLAAGLGLAGNLHNAPGLVRLSLTGERPALERFLAELPQALPPGARLEPLEPRWLEAGEALVSGATAPAAGSAPTPGFAETIAPTLTISAEPEGVGTPLAIGLIAPSLAADRAPCAACLCELDDPASRRHGDPFLSCSACGPRYSIATAEPWRRAHTTLAGFAPCPACAAEFADPADRRFHSETISCPRCGPRLSLLIAPADPAESPWPSAPTAPSPQRLRHQPSPPRAPAAALPLHAPGSPYESPGSLPSTPQRSALSAPVALPSPPPQGHSAAAHHAALVAAAAALLERGQILALQGVGGFQLLVDASNAGAVARLRRRKRRPAKPFALLVADPAWVAEAADLSEAALAQLRSPAAPIVLLPRRHAEATPAETEPRTTKAARPEPGPEPLGSSSSAWKGHSGSVTGIGLDPDGHRVGFALDPYVAVAPGSAQLGVMLPASPLHLLLARRFGRPLVCTSGNRSGEPLCTDPAEAVERLAGIADAVLIHNRPVARPLDDSVLQLIDGRPALLRRARGFAPEPLELAGGAPGWPAANPDANAAAAAAAGPSAGSGDDPRHERRRAETAQAGRRVAHGLAGADQPFEGSAPTAAVAARTNSAALQIDVALQIGVAGGPSAPEPPSAALALGGDLKCAPALASGGRVWLAPHLGDLAEPRVHARLQDGLAELRQRWGPALSQLLGDRHPGYLSHQLAQRISQASPQPPSQPLNAETCHRPAQPHPPQHLQPEIPEPNDPWLTASAPIPLLTVQHHAAHALAVIAEHGLQPPVLALCADGLGYGDGDPPLWGGELLRIGPQRIARLACLRPLPLPGGEKACLEPRRAALGLLAAAGEWALQHPGAAASITAFEDRERALLLQMLERQVHCPWTSSLGRLFDAAASLLGVCQRLSHEGEAGLRLQGLAALTDGEPSDPYPAYPFPASASHQRTPPLGWLDWEPALAALLADRAAGVPVHRCAARFHRGLAEGWAALLAKAAAELGSASAKPSATGAIAELIARTGETPTETPQTGSRQQVVLAGGCFQNALLLEALIQELRQRGLEPFWAEAVPGNDGGLALGQLEAWRRGMTGAPA